MGSSEPLFDELGYQDKAKTAALVIEADTAPPAALVEEVAKCGLEAEKLTFLFAPTSSLAGSVQVAGRSLEVALHKAHELHFPLENIVDGMATVPIPPPVPGFVEAMGRTNDAIIYGGRALYVEGDEAAAACRRSAERQFEGLRQAVREIFAAVKGDFYQIDPMLFSPAKVTVTSLSTGKSFEKAERSTTPCSRAFLRLALHDERHRHPHGPSSYSAMDGIGTARAFARVRPARYQPCRRSPAFVRLLDGYGHGPRHTGPRRPHAARRLRAVHSRRQFRTGHALPRHPACVARAWRHGLERCPCHRALCR